MRFNDIRDLAERITGFTVYRPVAPAVRTTIATTAIVEDDTALSVAAITGFATNDPVGLIGQAGDADLVFVGSTPSGTSIPLKTPTKIPARVGSSVIKLAAVDLGEVVGGVTLSGSGTQNRIRGSISRTPLGSFISDGVMGGSTQLRHFNGPNLQFAFGVPEKTSGTGATATPYSAAVRGSQIGREGLMYLVGSGLMNDGITAFDLIWANAKIVPQINSAIGAGGDAATLGIQWDATCLVLRTTG